MHGDRADRSSNQARGAERVAYNKLLRPAAEELEELGERAGGRAGGQDSERAPSPTIEKRAAPSSGLRRRESGEL
jgi:hypothetical protein